MAITGVHALLYSPEAEALRAVLRDVFGWDHVDDGQGWLIFRLPPAELGVHPGDSPSHELSFLCDDLAATVEELRAKGVEVRGEPQDQGWGVVTTIVLPGGVDVLLYEPRHATAI
jgi:hypothetical protein